ncbi:hypothetical protein, partial [Klebsiella variicola]
ILGRWAPGPEWRVEAGVFRSGRDDPIAFANLLTSLTPGGQADQVVIVDPHAYNASTSGELRVSRSFAGEAWRHEIVLT